MSAYKTAVRHAARMLREAGVDAPLCEGVVPDGAGYPCVLIQAYGDPVDTTGNGDYRHATTVDLLVRVVGEATDREVERIAAATDGALHGSASGQVAGCRRVSESVQVAVEDGTQWLYLGGLYRHTVAGWLSGE